MFASFTTCVYDPAASALKKHRVDGREGRAEGRNRTLRQTTAASESSRLQRLRASRLGGVRPGASAVLKGLAVFGGEGEGGAHLDRAGVAGHPQHQRARRRCGQRPRRSTCRRRGTREAGRAATQCAGALRGLGLRARARADWRGRGGMKRAERGGARAEGGGRGSDRRRRMRC
jgi:hypothetical protein